ncbi:MAG: ParB/RepB/Spo0J family partition protein [Planctomycetes bacterium]|nr:ParB/RepB/Spo0J family partition protein [Planctomycetota bacterium]
MSTQARPKAKPAAPAIATVPIGTITASPNNLRKRFDDDALARLAETIKAHGILQPLVVRPKAAGRFELVAGERRFRAAKLAWAWR